MIIDRDKTEADLVRFVQSRALQAVPVTPEMDLIENGLLDSLLLVDLIFYLEETYGVRFESDHIDPANFFSIATIADLVAGRVAAADKPRD